MRTSSGIILLCAFLVCVSQARARVLPDACGDDKVKFGVKTENSKTAPAPPPDGKAQIVFIENENQMIGTLMYATVRFGLDGAWAGANYNNSYFVVNVDPGAHHLCASWQSALGMISKNVDMASFTAQPGKVYYFAGNVKVNPIGDNYANANFEFSLTQLNDDEGQYRVKAWKVSTSKPK